MYNIHVQSNCVRKYEQDSGIYFRLLHFHTEQLSMQS
jgi:hypothetical protein